jgi:SET domain-containing protein
MQRETDSYLTPKAEARRKPNGQMGIFAREPIARDEIVSVWGGEILTRAQVQQLPERLQQYVMQVEQDFFLGGGTQDATNYFNHSCNPNVGFSGQLVLLALRDIAPDQEICFDYAMCDGSAYDEFECQCGAPNCRKKIRGTDWQIPELWERYRGYFVPYLQRRIDRLQTKTKTS